MIHCRACYNNWKAREI